MSNKQEHAIRIWCARGFAISMIAVTLGQGVQNHLHNVYRPVPITSISIRPASLQRSTPPPVVHIKRTKAVVRPKRVTNEVLCLAQNIFFESAYEPMAGIEAVAAVVFNRMSSALYPSTVCGVVYQRAQFSWTTDYAKWKRVPPQKYMALAKAFLQNRDTLQQTYNSFTHFHHVKVFPAWGRHATLRHAATYGQHKFYAQVTSFPQE